MSHEQATVQYNLLSYQASSALLLSNAPSISKPVKLARCASERSRAHARTQFSLTPSPVRSSHPRLNPAATSIQ